MRLAKNHRVRNGTTTPMTDVLPDFRLAACGDGTYCSCAAAASTLARGSGRTRSSPRRARDTVAVETPAAAATSWMRLSAVRSAGRPRAVRATSALEPARQEPPDEVALHREEHRDRDDDRDERACRQQVPCRPLRAGQVGERDRERRDVGRPAGEGQRDEQVVPDPEELEDGERRDRRG